MQRQPLLVCRAPPVLSVAVWCLQVELRPRRTFCRLGAVSLEALPSKRRRGAHCSRCWTLPPSSAQCSTGPCPRAHPGCLQAIGGLRPQLSRHHLPGRVARSMRLRASPSRRSVAAMKMPAEWKQGQLPRSRSSSSSARRVQTAVALGMTSRTGRQIQTEVHWGLLAHIRRSSWETQHRSCTHPQLLRVMAHLADLCLRSTTGMSFICQRASAPAVRVSHLLSQVSLKASGKAVNKPLRWRRSAAPCGLLVVWTVAFVRTCCLWWTIWTGQHIRRSSKREVQLARPNPQATYR
mmetsp:Transcript_58802/g.102913  ORF Transcript_58802/g.102913 Transcript_58802/m.102913 type:complete len:293 (+) Transcript_58802:386-1264(+)